MSEETWSDEDLRGLMEESLEEEDPYFYALTSLGCSIGTSMFHHEGLSWVIEDGETLRAFIRFVEIMNEFKKGQEIFDAGRESVFIEMEMDMQKSKTSTKH